MTIFLRILRYFSQWEAAYAEYRAQCLTDSFCLGLVDLDQFIARKSDILVVRKNALDDADKWARALRELEMNT